VAEVITRDRNRRGPDRGADRVQQDEPPQRNRADAAGDERRCVAYAVDEPEPEQHRYLIAPQQLVGARQAALQNRRLRLPARPVDAPQPVRGLIAAKRTDERHDDDQRQIEQFAVREKAAEQRDRFALEERADEYRHIAVLLDKVGQFDHR